MTTNETWDRRALGALLMAYAFFAPLSIAVSEPLLLLAVFVWIYGLVRGRETGGLKGNPYAVPVLTFILVALLTNLWALHPDETLHRAHRLFFLLAVFALPSAFGRDPAAAPERARQAVLCFVAGAALRGLYDVVRVVVAVARGQDILYTGNMRDPQMYMVAVCFLGAALVHRKETGGHPLRLVALAAAAAGLVLHFKRGVWFATALSASAMGAAARRWKAIGVVALCALTLLAVPWTRERLVMLQTEVHYRFGGRYTLWAGVAPKMLREYPQGIGWSGTRSSDFARYSRRVQRKLNHLHNNLLQVALETGWVGAAVWSWWMLTAAWVMYAAYARARVRRDAAAWLCLGTLGAFLGLLFDGVVEYNFGDTEILMLLCFLMGLSCLLARTAGGAAGNAAS